MFSAVSLKRLHHPPASPFRDPPFIHPTIQHCNSLPINLHLRPTRNVFVMDRPILSPTLNFDCSPSHPPPLSSPDPEARGRSKRRRDPLTLNSFSSLTARSRGESSTLRGRRRHRSPSRMNLVASRASTAASTPRDVREEDMSPPPSPEKRRLVAVALVLRPENHRRSQVPSRSRSPDGSGGDLGMGKAEVVSVVMSQRRRQRTQSRSRRHGLDEALASGGQARSRLLGFEGWTTDRNARDGD